MNFYCYMLLFDRDAGFDAAHDNLHRLESELKLINSNLFRIAAYRPQQTRETNINNNVHANIQHKDAGIYTVQTMKSSKRSNEDNMRNKKCITHLILQTNQS